MDENIKQMLDEEIMEEITDLSILQSGSEEKSTAIDELVKLHKLRIEEAKVELEGEKLKKDPTTEQSKDRYLKFGLEAAGIVLPLIFYAVWMNKGFKFEETGTYTSTTFRGLFNRFKPTNK